LCATTLPPRCAITFRPSRRAARRQRARRAPAVRDRRAAAASTDQNSGCPRPAPARPDVTAGGGAGDDGPARSTSGGTFASASSARRSAVVSLAVRGSIRASEFAAPSPGATRALDSIASLQPRTAGPRLRQRDPFMSSLTRQASAHGPAGWMGPGAVLRYVTAENAPASCIIRRVSVMSWVWHPISEESPGNSAAARDPPELNSVAFTAHGVRRQLARVAHRQQSDHELATRSPPTLRRGDEQPATASRSPTI
jgi:hypothetical protein